MYYLNTTANQNWDCSVDNRQTTFFIAVSSPKCSKGAEKSVSTIRETGCLGHSK